MDETVKMPKVSFGIIVLNGEPFTRYCLRSLYPFAHEIIVVEGANKASAFAATKDGHSTDGTLEALRRFKSEEDPDGKVRVVTRDGLWTEKDEQSRAYAELATGDYLWQVDVDEFYMPGDVNKTLSMLRDDPDITAVSFKQVTFWGGPDYVVDGWYLRNGADIYHRLFKWGEGYRYASHRPPTVVDSLGRDLRSLRWIGGNEMAKRGVRLYHYSLMFPKQVYEKSGYYSRVDWVTDKKKSGDWAENNYFKLKNPYRLHNVYQYPGWLERYCGDHPPAIWDLMDDIREDRISVELRDNRDVEKLLATRRYALGVALLSAAQPIDKMLNINRVINFADRILGRE